MGETSSMAVRIVAMFLLVSVGGCSAEEPTAGPDLAKRVAEERAEGKG